MDRGKNVLLRQTKDNSLNENTERDERGKIIFRRILVTPEKAQTWLMGQAENRRLNDFTWKRYAETMQAGKWTESTDPIGFRGLVGDGLVNGQHRLRAIVYTGIPQWMWIAENVPAEAILFLDTGRSRRIHEILFMRGHTKATSGVMATLRVMIQGESLRDLRNAPALTPDRIEAQFIEHQDAILFPHEYLKTTMRGVNVSGVRGAIARAYYHVKHEDLQRFCEVLSSGLVNTPVENWPSLLRGQLLADLTGHSGQLWQYRVYLKAERALYNYGIVKKPGDRLMQATRELFPLPGEAIDKEEINEEEQSLAFSSD